MIIAIEAGAQRPPESRGQRPLRPRRHRYARISRKTIRDSRLPFIIAPGPPAAPLGGGGSRGSLDFVAAAPFGKRRIALEKLAAHLTMLGLAMAILAAFTTISSPLFGDAALGDQVPLLSSVGFALWAGFLAVFFGGLALALAPVLGRAGSTGVAGLAMVVLWVMNGLNLGGPLAVLSPFRWTADHIALIGQYDWAPLALVGVAGAVFLAIGVELFGRRDLGVTP